MGRLAPAHLKVCLCQAPGHLNICHLGGLPGPFRAWSEEQELPAPPSQAAGAEIAPAREVAETSLPVPSSAPHPGPLFFCETSESGQALWGHQGLFPADVSVRPCALSFPFQTACHLSQGLFSPGVAWVCPVHPRPPALLLCLAHRGFPRTACPAFLGQPLEHRWGRGFSSLFSCTRLPSETKLDCITLCPAHHRTSSSHSLCRPPGLCPVLPPPGAPPPSCALTRCPLPLLCLGLDAILPGSLP